MMLGTTESQIIFNISQKAHIVQTDKIGKRGA